MNRATQLAATVQVSIWVMAWSMQDRAHRVLTDDRGDGGGKGVIILVATVLGLIAVVGVGLLITNQINKRAPGLETGNP